MILIKINHFQSVPNIFVTILDEIILHCLLISGKIGIVKILEENLLKH